jgi:hypothetical protein
MSSVVGVSGPTEEALRRLAEPPAWLLRIAEPSAVAPALTRWVPELRSGELTLLECDVRRLRIKRTAWTGLYRVTVGASGADQPRVVDLRAEILPQDADAARRPGADGAFGSETWRCYLPELRLDLAPEPLDVALPALPALTDPDEARALLESAIRVCAPEYADLRIRSCSPRVMRYKPGSRCTVLYELEYPPDSTGDEWPDRVVAKTYHGDKGKNAYAGMRALWRSELRRSGAVSIAEPLAFLPDMNVLVQGPVPGDRTLKDVLQSAFGAGDGAAMEELEPYVSKAALGLAALHGCGVAPGEVVTWDDELAEVREVIERLAARVPELSEAAAPLLSHLEAVAAENPPDPLAPSHRSFRPAQVLLDGVDIGFIDFDGFCRAEPALDLALFRATVKDVGMYAASERARKADARRLERLCELFLTRYEEASSASRPRVALWEALDLLTAVLHCWTKVKFERLPDRLELLRRHLRASGLEA